MITGQQKPANAPPAVIQRFPSAAAFAASADDDMFVIPASQVTTQSRYVSQRSMLGRTQLALSCTGGSNLRTARNYFERVLHKCGVQLIDQPDCVLLDCDHLAFVARLRRALRCDATYPANVREFVGGLEAEARAPAQLARLMGGCKVQQPQQQHADEQPPRLTQESLMQDLLMVECLQDELRRLLFGKLQLFAAEEE